MKIKLFILFILIYTVNLNAEPIFRILNNNKEHSFNEINLNPICGEDHGKNLFSITKPCLQGEPSTITNDTNNFNWSCSSEGKQINCSANKEPDQICEYNTNGTKSFLDYFLVSTWYSSRPAFKYQESPTDYFIIYFDGDYSMYEYIVSSGKFAGIGPNYIKNNFWAGEVKFTQAGIKGGNAPISEGELCKRNPLPERTLELVSTRYYSNSRRVWQYSSTRYDWFFDQYRWSTPISGAGGSNFKIHEPDYIYVNDVRVYDAELGKFLLNTYSIGARRTTTTFYQIVETKMQ